VTVPDAAIVAAMRHIWDVMKIIVEPSGATAYAALAAGRLELRGGTRVGVVLSGGNLDLGSLPWIKPARE
jgi:threonine dehydratase